MSEWTIRPGHHTGLHWTIYEDGKPVASTHTQEDAERIITALARPAPDDADDIAATPLPIVATVRAGSGGIVDLHPTLQPDDPTPAPDDGAVRAAVERLIAATEPYEKNLDDEDRDTLLVARAALDREDEVGRLQAALEAIGQQVDDLLELVAIIREGAAELQLIGLKNEVEGALGILQDILYAEQAAALAEKIRDVDWPALADQTVPRERRSFKDGLRSRWWER